MFNSVVLDVVIGLVFIYLLYSLLATTLQELIASAFSFRSKILERAIFRMLEDETKTGTRIQSVFDLFKKTGHGGDPNSTSFSFYNHPLIKFLGENKRNSKPAYIDKETFSKVLVDLLRGNQVKPGDDVTLLIQGALDNKTINWGTAAISNETLSYLKSIWADSGGNVETFKIYLENWFDETMERATGWYKKHIQFLLFFLGLAISIFFNVDTLKIVSKLEKDPKLREQMVQQAETFLKAHPDLDQQLQCEKAEYSSFLSGNRGKAIQLTDSIRKIRTEDSLNVAKCQALKARTDSLLLKADSLVNIDLKKANNILGLGWETLGDKTRDAGELLKMLLGWIITAVAISLGAPFWFDLLNKLMKLRGSVTSSAPDDKQRQRVP